MLGGTVSAGLWGERAKPCLLGQDRFGQAAGRLSRMGRGALAASQGSQHQTQDGPGNCGTSLLPGILCQDMPLKDRGRRGLVSHEGTDPKRKQEGGDRETGG